MPLIIPSIIYTRKEVGNILTLLLLFQVQKYAEILKIL